MTLDEVILTEARELRQAQMKQEHLAARAKVDFQDAVRRLHAAGGSLREIAEAFGVSHQWVHQIVGEESPTKPISGGDIACSFCRSSQKEVKKLVAGPGVYICGECILLAERAVAGEPSETMTRVADGSALRCQFCRKRHAKVAHLVEAREGRICNECIDLCVDILAEDLSREEIRDKVRNRTRPPKPTAD